MRSKSILSGINVPISPTATADSKLTNIINVAYNSEQNVENPFKEKTRDIPNELESYLLKLYQSILLCENKKLLSNIITKESIILTQEDLETVIKLQTGKKVVINYVEPDLGCIKVNQLFLKVESIRIEEDDGSISDYFIKYNKEYLDLLTKYKLNLKYLLIN